MNTESGSAQANQWLPHRHTAAIIMLVLIPVNALPRIAAAAETETPLPTAKEIIDRHLDAIGGTSRITEHKSYRCTGTFELPGRARGTLEMFGKQPQKHWLKVELPNGGKYLRASDGLTLWHFNPQSGDRSRDDWEFHAKQGLKRHEDQAQRHLSEMLDLFAVLDTPSQAQGGVVTRRPFQGQPCYEVQSARQTDSTSREYFDPKSGLRVGAVYSGTNSETFLLGDYREFHGIKMATRVTRLVGEKTNDVFTITSVEFTDVPDSKFAMPMHVPEWPAGWNEIDEAYPPGFAKSSLPWPWKGEHSRWFSPGFGKTNDLFFWSYAVFNALEGDTLNFASEVQDALHRYDSSLYGKAFAPARIKVSVGPASLEEKLGHEVTHRSVVIDGFDAEASKKELRTYLETFRWYCPTVNRTAFLILRSPRPYHRGDEVWEVLRQFADGLICHFVPPTQTANDNLRRSAGERP